jgi:peptidoglycan/LPS O-acetylase OafA/YrhL
MTVAEKLSTRDNGVTLLRLGLAALVVYGHSWEVSGHGPDPLQRGAGVTCGEVGVNAFFALSGFLVTQSWLRSRSAEDYLWRRSLRILPGFWVCLLVTGLGLFPALWMRAHHTGWRAALSQAPFVGYILHNALLRVRQATIGDLFASQPAAGVVNGALWSLFPEFLCYLGVAAAGLLGGFAARRRAWRWLGMAAVYALHVGGPLILAHLGPRSFGAGWYLWRLSTQAGYFAMGALGCVGGESLRTNPVRLGLGLILLGLALAFHAYPELGPLFLPFALLQLAALLPGAWLDRIGDYSYGLYVYHFPVQQTLVFLGWAGLGATAFFGLTLAFALPVAVLSWHAVERPALRWKHLFSGRSAAGVPVRPPPP